MQVSQTVDTGTGNVAAASPARRRVIDAPTRMFHWIFAFSFIGAYATAESEHWRTLHVTLGYTFAGLFGLRMLYGFLGPRQAGLGHLARRLGTAPAWLRTVAQTRPVHAINWRQGQNLAMTAVILAMMTIVVPIVVSGYITYEEWGGSFIRHLLEEVHEFFGNALLTLVSAHLGLLALLSVLRRQNQARPMISGYVPGAGASPVKHNRAWLAALLLFGVVAFWTSQW